MVEIARNILQNGTRAAGVFTGYSAKSLKDGASFCYCAYILRILGYSGLLRNLPANTNNIFVRFMSMWKRQILARAIRIQKENWG